MKTKILSGNIQFYNEGKGYGSLMSKDNKQYFFKYNDVLAYGKEELSLKENDTVFFIESFSEKKELNQATYISKNINDVENFLLSKPQVKKTHKKNIILFNVILILFTLLILLNYIFNH